MVSKSIFLNFPGEGSPNSSSDLSFFLGLHRSGFVFDSRTLRAFDFGFALDSQTLRAFDPQLSIGALGFACPPINISGSAPDSLLSVSMNLNPILYKVQFLPIYLVYYTVSGYFTNFIG